MNPEQALVAAFHKKFGVPSGERYRPLTQAEREFRKNLILEEANEFAEAADRGDAPGMVDAIMDILYVSYGAACMMGLDTEPFFNEVHRTNMLKEGGATRADGKILKPAGWKSPDIERLLIEQGWEGWKP